MSKKEEFFGVRPGVIIFFHFRNGSVSHLRWNTEADGKDRPWNKHQKDGDIDSVSHEVVLEDGLLKDRRDCLQFMLTLARMHGIMLKEVSIQGRDPEKDGNGSGTIALQFI